MLAAISAAKAAPAAPAARRQQPTSLPRVCFAYDKSRKAVLGLFVVSECSRLPDNAGIVFWRVERAVALDDAPILDAADVAWSSAILHLTLQAEDRLRHVETIIGGAAFVHFTEWARQRWHLWPMTVAQWGTIRVGSMPATMETAFSMARALKVEPTLVRHPTFNSGKCLMSPRAQFHFLYFA